MSELQFKRRGNRLRVAGDMTIYQATAAKAELMRFIDGSDAPEVDLSQVSEFDSSGVQLLALARREAAVQGKALRLSACSQSVQKVLDTYRLADWISQKPATKALRRTSHEGS